MSILRPQLHQKVAKLQNTRFQTAVRRPLNNDIRRLLSFCRANRLEVNQLSDSEMIIFYRRKEIMYLDTSAYYNYKYIGYYYNYQLARSMKLKGKFIQTHQGMLILSYSSLKDVASDLITYTRAVDPRYTPSKSNF